MRQQSPVLRRTTKAWQFSIASLLLAITLIAVTCAAFRLDIGVGICELHLTLAITIAAVRTRAALRHQEELWDAIDCPDSARRNESFQLGKSSFGVAIVTLFFFHVGFWSAAFPVFAVAVLFFPLGTIMGAPVEWFLLLMIFGAGLLSSALWLIWTWPKSYFLRTASTSSPSAKIG